MNDDLEGWEAVLRAIPAMPLARCKSNPELWEDADPVAIHAAEQTCQHYCEELQACTDYLNSLRPAQRPSNCVMAGAWQPEPKPRPARKRPAA